MRLKITILLLVFFLNKSYANEIIKLPKHFKVESTFSGDLPDNKSFHLIFTKNTNTKNFEVFSYIYDGVKSEKLNTFVSEKPYGIVSFHYDNDIISLVLSYKIKKDYFVKRIGINTVTKAIEETEALPHDDLLTSIRNKKSSTLIYKTKEEFIIRQFFGNLPLKKYKLEIKDKEHEIKKFFKDNNVSSINTNEFVSNGATSKVRVYSIGDKLIFTKENDSDNKTETLEVLFDKDNLKTSFKTFINTGEKKYKRNTSFIMDNRLYHLGVSKEEGSIKIWDISSKKTLNEISINDALISKSTTSKDFEGFEIFLKQASRKKHNPTITVNKTENNNFLLRVDYVDVLYSYHYNWWWHHHMMMQMHQQMHMQNMMNSAPSFGPAFSDDYIFENYTLREENHHFELLIDESGNMLPKDKRTDTIYKEIDKEEYIDTLDDVKGIKHESSCFLEDSFRYIAYSKSFDGFVFKTNKLK